MMALKLSFYGTYLTILLQSAVCSSVNGDCAAELKQAGEEFEAYSLDALTALKEMFSQQQSCVGGNDFNMKQELKRTKAKLAEMEKNFGAVVAGTGFSALAAYSAIKLISIDLGSHKVQTGLLNFTIFQCLQP